MQLWDGDDDSRDDVTSESRTSSFGEDNEATYAYAKALYRTDSINLSTSTLWKPAYFAYHVNKKRIAPLKAHRSISADELTFDPSLRCSAFSVWSIIAFSSVQHRLVSHSPTSIDFARSIWCKQLHSLNSTRRSSVWFSISIFGFDWFQFQSDKRNSFLSYFVSRLRFVNLDFYYFYFKRCNQNCTP